MLRHCLKLDRQPDLTYASKRHDQATRSRPSVINTPDFRASETLGSNDGSATWEVMKARHSKEIINIENNYGSVEHYCDVMHEIGNATIYVNYVSQFTTNIWFPESPLELPPPLNGTTFRLHYAPEYSHYPSTHKDYDLEAQYQNAELKNVNHSHCSSANDKDAYINKQLHDLEMQGIHDYGEYIRWYSEHAEKHFRYLNRRLTVYGVVGLLCCITGCMRAYFSIDPLSELAGGIAVFLKGMVVSRLGYCVEP
ncbi:hypothetical protein E8E11_010991 [Didymella keratinophila]|nr:hypothetical protein E8E11_010991 [Didymella keratinophila]